MVVWEKTCILAVLCVGSFCFLGKTHGFLGKNLYWHIVLGNIGLVGPFSLGLIEVVHFWQFLFLGKTHGCLGKNLYSHLHWQSCIFGVIGCRSLSG